MPIGKVLLYDTQSVRPEIIYVEAASNCNGTLQRFRQLMLRHLLAERVVVVSRADKTPSVAPAIAESNVRRRKSPCYCHLVQAQAIVRSAYVEKALRRLGSRSRRVLPRVGLALAVVVWMFCITLRDPTPDTVGARC